MAKALLEQGKKKQAHDVFAKCVDVTPEMAYQLIKVSLSFARACCVVHTASDSLPPQALRDAGVEFIVAPFEADAQLAFLEKMGVIAGVITEDSDLLVFGCRTASASQLLYSRQAQADASHPHRSCTSSTLMARVWRSSKSV